MDITQPGAVPNPDTSLEPVEYFNDASGVNFTLDGPMARAYTEALGELYKKEIGPDGMTLESLSFGLDVMDGWKNYNWMRATRGGMTQQAPFLGLGMVYGVRKHEFSLQHFDELVQAVGRMNSEQRLASAVILDAEPVSDTVASHHFSPVAVEALTQLVKTYCAKAAPAIPVYPSLQAFIKARS